MAASTRPGLREPGSAHRPTAPSERSQPSRPARRTTSASSRSSRVSTSSTKEPRRLCSVSSRASATATSVSAATAATWRYSPAASFPLPSIRTAPSSWPPETIGTSAVTSERPVGPGARKLRGHVALQGGPGLDGRPQPRHDHRDLGPGVGRGDLGDALHAVAGQHRAHHLEVGAARRGKRFGVSHERSRQGDGAAPSWRRPFPDGPVLTPRSESRPTRGPGGRLRPPHRSAGGRRPQPAGRTACRRRQSRSERD